MLTFSLGHVTLVVLHTSQEHFSGAGYGYRNVRLRGYPRIMLKSKLLLAEDGSWISKGLKHLCSKKLGSETKMVMLK